MIINFIFNINMYKYIFFVVLGIIIYLYYNRNDNFSVGGQITQSIEQLESMARRIAMGKEDPSQKLCSISGVERCQLEQDRLGGSCSINALAGLVYTSASFTQEYQDFFNLTAEYILQKSYVNGYKCIMNMPNMIPIIEENRLNVSQTIKQHNLLYNLLNNKLYFMGNDYKFTNIHVKIIPWPPHGFLIYKISKIELSRLLEIMEGYLDMEEYQIIYTLLKNKFDAMIDDSFGLLIIDFCNNIFDIITDENYPITTSEGLSEPYSEEYNKLWKLKVFWFWIKIFNDEITFIDVDGEKTVTTNSDNSDKDRLNRLILSQIDNYNIFIYNTNILNDGEEIEIKECTEPENLRRLYHLSVTLKTEGGFSDDGNFTIFRPDVPTAHKLYGDLYNQLDSISLTEWDHNKKALFLMSIETDDMQEIIEMMEDGVENVLEQYIDAEPGKKEIIMEKINRLYPPSECAAPVIEVVD